jgi:hypothetical protein
VKKPKPKPPKPKWKQQSKANGTKAGTYKRRDMRAED